MIGQGKLCCENMMYTGKYAKEALIDTDQSVKPFKFL